MIYNLSFNHKLPDDAIIIDATSNSADDGKYLSPFNVGPVDLYDGYWAYNVENAYQFCKIFPAFNFPEGEIPSPAYFEWAIKGWQTKTPIKHPFGAWTHGLFHWWSGKRLNRLEAQNQIFVPSYAKAIVKTTTFQKLKQLYEQTDKDIVLLDYEGYRYKDLDMSLDDVFNHKEWPVGQGFVLTALLEGFI